MFEVFNCPAGRQYNVFGFDTDHVCCYRFMDYCYNCPDCSLKSFLRLEDNIRFKSYFGYKEFDNVSKS